MGYKDRLLNYVLYSRLCVVLAIGIYRRRDSQGPHRMGCPRILPVTVPNSWSPWSYVAAFAVESYYSAMS